MVKQLVLLMFFAILPGTLWPGYGYDGQAAADDKNAAIQAPVNRAKTPPNGEVVDEEASLPAGTVEIIPARQQLIGVRTGQAQKAPQHYVIRTLGRVANDETRIYRINAAVEGWIWKTFDEGTGSLVNKDQVLASFYSPEFLSAEQAYIFAVSTFSRYHQTGKENDQQIALTETNIKQYKDTLLNLGMAELQIEELGRTHRYTESIKIASPVTGFLLSRQVSPGERFVRGRELYSVVDLRRVWILADLFEKEPYNLSPGTRVTVRVPYQKRTFEATVSDVLPVFDGPSRTLKVRMETDNPDYYLRPDMFVDIEIPIELPTALTVPSDAVIDSGLRKTIYVDRGNGFFEPREVETGREIDDRVEITGGLEPGERIALSATFLIDSESRMERAASGMYENLSKDPVSGLDVSVNKAMKAGYTSTYRGRTYYFSSDASKKKFDSEPKPYIQEE